jgi:hypothetical protein
MYLLVFLHGTVLMHCSGVGCDRAARVRQCREGDPSIREYATYVPVDGAVAKLAAWRRQEAKISYLSSHRRIEHVLMDVYVLRHHAFPEGQVCYRSAGETYQDVVARILPDVLIEDDCESIGGAVEMITPHLPPDLRARIVSIVVPEFGGIDHLPDDITTLMVHE